MQESDKAQFEAIIRGLGENFSAKVTKEGLQLRFAALKQFSAEDIQNAAMHLLATRKFTTMPTVADFIEYLGGGSIEDVAEIEAGKVWNAVREYGGAHTVCFDDPVTMAAIVHGFGGWTKLCAELMEDQRKWFYIEFKKTYGAYARRKHGHYEALPGSASSEVKFIGDKVKAENLLTGGEKQIEILTQKALSSP